MTDITQLFQHKGFRIHFIVFAAVNALLFVVDMLTSPGTYWFQWPLIGWGIGILGHAFLANQEIQRKNAKSAIKKEA